MFESICVGGGILCPPQSLDQANALMLPLWIGHVPLNIQLLKNMSTVPWEFIYYMFCIEGSKSGVGGGDIRPNKCILTEFPDTGPETRRLGRHRRWKTPALVPSGSLLRQIVDTIQSPYPNSTRGMVRHPKKKREFI